MISELADLSRGSVSSECETHESVTVSNGPSPIAIQIRGDVNKWRRDMKPAIISIETAEETFRSTPRQECGPGPLRHDPVGAATSKAAAIIME